RGRSAPYGTAASPAAPRCEGGTHQQVQQPAPIEPGPVRSPRQSPVVADDADAAFGSLVAKAELGRSEQAIHDHVAAAHPIVYEFRGLAIRTDDEQRRHLALGDAARKFDVDLAAVIEGVQRPPWRIVAFDGVAEAQAADVETGIDGRSSFSDRVLAAERNDLVLGIDPRH